MCAVMTMLENMDEPDIDPISEIIGVKTIDEPAINEQVTQIKNQIISFTKRRRNCVFLKNTITFRCDQCNKRYRVSYYDILVNGNFKLQSPVHTLTTYVREAEYEEDVTVTPIVANKLCTECNTELMQDFPVSLEYLLVILQSRPPDSGIYA